MVDLTTEQLLAHLKEVAPVETAGAERTHAGLVDECLGGACNAVRQPTPRGRLK